MYAFLMQVDKLRYFNVSNRSMGDTRFGILNVTAGRGVRNEMIGESKVVAKDGLKCDETDVKGLL